MAGVNRTMWMVLVATLAMTGACSSNQPDPVASATAGRAPVDAAAQSYVDAVNAGDLDALVASFAEDGVVVDVSRRISGRDAIRAWAAAEVIGGRLEVLNVTPTEGGQDLLVRWRPGGSGGWEARYRLTYDGGLIAEANLQYA